MISLKMESLLLMSGGFSGKKPLFAARVL